jgi:hypothetical protein
MTIVIKKRGRPTNEELAMKAARNVKVQRSDAEVLQDLKDRFGILSVLTKGAVQQNIRAATVTGAPGVGKTYTVEKILSEAHKSKGIKYDIIRGAISAVNLYKTAYELRKAGSVLVLDDADSIFNDEDALNILKVLCDTSDTRKVSWKKESQALREDDVPQSFEFEGSIIFISNLDFQKFVEEGRNKYAQHFEALISRSMYLDLRLHSRNEIAVWIEYIAKDGMLFRREGITPTQGQQALAFLKKYRDELRELSIRTLLKTSQLIKTHDNWETMARILLVKSH